MFGINKIIPVNSNYQFMKLRKRMLYISVFLIISSIILLIFKGLNLGIDFKGGTLIEVSIKNTDIAELRQILNSEFNDNFGQSTNICHNSWPVFPILFCYLGCQS